MKVALLIVLWVLYTVGWYFMATGHFHPIWPILLILTGLSLWEITASYLLEDT